MWNAHPPICRRNVRARGTRRCRWRRPSNGCTPAGVDAPEGGRRDPRDRRKICRQPGDGHRLDEPAPRRSALLVGFPTAACVGVRLRNGPFGIGWHLSLPAITRKTDKGLPRYLDAGESDVLLISGVDDLVPLLTPADGGWVREEQPVRRVNGASFRLDRYRARIEGFFARIERWSNLADTTDIRWRAISRGNTVTGTERMPPAASQIPQIPAASLAGSFARSTTARETSCSTNTCQTIRRESTFPGPRNATAPPKAAGSSMISGVSATATGPLLPGERSG